MLDERPTAAELIAAVADFIEKKVAPQLDAHTGFHTKVAVNALRIVERELQQGEQFTRDERASLLALLGDAPAASGTDADLNTLNKALCEQINSGNIATDNSALLDHLRKSVLARIAIDSPKYPSLKVVHE